MLQIWWGDECRFSRCLSVGACCFSEIDKRQIVKAMLGIDISVCQQCQNSDFERDFIAPDSAWLSNNVKGYRLKKKGRSPPAKQLKIAFKVQ